MPILGTIASQVTGKIPSLSFESIATATVGSGGASSVTFSSIPSTFKHLQIRGSFIPATTDYSAVLRVNGDASSSSYVAHSLSGSSSDSSITYSPSSIRVLYTQDATNASTPAACIVDILDYQNTNKKKTFRIVAGIDSNTNVYGSRIVVGSGLWNSTSVIDSITLYSAVGGYGSDLSSTFRQYSHFALYGIKG